jgi:hypothetical protein
LEKAMSNLLIHESPLVVLPSLAVKYGLNEAIVIQQIQYWSRKADVSDDGFAWVYNTIPDWKKQFPFWSERTIFSILKGLREAGILVAEKRSKSPWNQTLYYRLNYKIFEQNISQGLQDRERKSCDNTVNTETTREYSEYFKKFWKYYPKKTAKEQAWKAFKKLKMDAAFLSTLISAINEQGLPNRDIQFVPHASTWLNNKRWEDEITPNANQNLILERRVL